jgi:hypothetical protein
MKLGWGCFVRSNQTYQTYLLCEFVGLGLFGADESVGSDISIDCGDWSQTDQTYLLFEFVRLGLFGADGPDGAGGTVG